MTLITLWHEIKHMHSINAQLITWSYDFRLQQTMQNVTDQQYDIRFGGMTIFRVQISNNILVGWTVFTVHFNQLETCMKENTKYKFEPFTRCAKKFRAWQLDSKTVVELTFRLCLKFLLLVFVLLILFFTLKNICAKQNNSKFDSKRYENHFLILCKPLCNFWKTFFLILRVIILFDVRVLNISVQFFVELILIDKKNMKNKFNFLFKKHCFQYISSIST